MATLFLIGKVIVLIFAVVMIFNLMILVHEWGHFLAARWRGLKIEKFQIWFGKPIWKKTINGVQYGLGTIPFGGFVALPQMAPMEALEGKAEGEPLPKISPLDKIIVAFAGPLFSFLLALFFAVIVWGVGKPVDATSETRTIGWVMEDMPGAAAGFLPGDEIVSVDGYAVRGFSGPIDSVTERIVHSRGETIEFVVRRDGKELPPIQSTFRLEEKGALERSGFRQVGLAPAQRVVVSKVLDKSPIALAGIKPGDAIIEINGTKVLSYLAVADAIKKADGQAINLVIDRDGKPLTFAVTPVKPLKPADAKPALGMVYGTEHVVRIQKPGPPPGEQVTDAGKVIFRTLGSLFSPKSDVGPSQMSGPVGIGNIYYRMLEDPTWGWRMILWFSVLLNVNLAMLNMLPFPVLDGGHITIAAMEAIRRRPVNFRFLEYVQVGCAVLLLGFMVFVTWFDSRDVVTQVQTEDEPPMEAMVFGEPDSAPVPPAN